MRITGGLERENDRLIQIWATKQRSYISFKPAECGHHYYSRRNHLLRWDVLNIIPLTYEEHTNFHSGKIEIIIKDEEIQKYLSGMAKKDYRQYLLENNLTEQEFIKKCNKKLKEKINELS